MTEIKIINGQAEQPPEYPCYKISSETGRIILFYRQGAGVVIREGNTNHDLGAHSTSWAEEGFQPFNGTITICETKE